MKGSDKKMATTQTKKLKKPVKATVLREEIVEKMPRSRLDLGHNHREGQKYTEEEEAELREGIISSSGNLEPGTVDTWPGCPKPWLTNGYRRESLCHELGYPFKVRIRHWSSQPTEMELVSQGFMFNGASVATHWTFHVAFCKTYMRPGISLSERKKLVQKGVLTDLPELARRLCKSEANASKYMTIATLPVEWIAEARALNFQMVPLYTLAAAPLPVETRAKVWEFMKGAKGKLPSDFADMVNVAKGKTVTAKSSSDTSTTGSGSGGDGGNGHETDEEDEEEETDAATFDAVAEVERVLLERKEEITKDVEAVRADGHTPSMMLLVVAYHVSDVLSKLRGNPVTTKDDISNVMHSIMMSDVMPAECA